MSGCGGAVLVEMPGLPEHGFDGEFECDELGGVGLTRGVADHDGVAFRLNGGRSRDPNSECHQGDGDEFHESSFVGWVTPFGVRVGIERETAAASAEPFVVGADV